MRFGKKGMSGESKTVVAILMVFGVLFMISFVWSFFSQGGGPPTGPEAVIKYYDDLLKGEYGGKKYSPTSLIIVLFVPLITSFSLIWTLARILPVFRQRENRQAAAVLAMGLSIYVIPTMSWMIMQVFPPLLGVSAILIGVAMLLMAIFVLVSTTYQFGGLKWGHGGGGGDGDHDRDYDDYRADRDTLDDWRKAGVSGREATSAQDRVNDDIAELGRLWTGFLNHKIFKNIVDAVNEGRPLSELDIDFLEKAKAWLNDYLNKIESVKRKALRSGVGTPFWRREVDADLEAIEKTASILLGKLQNKKPGDKLDLNSAAMRTFIETGEWLNREIDRLPGLGRAKFMPGESKDMRIPQKFQKDFDTDYEHIKRMTDKFYLHFKDIKPLIIREMNITKDQGKKNTYAQIITLISDYIGLYEHGGLEETFHSPDNFKKVILEEKFTTPFKERKEIQILGSTKTVLEHLRPLYLKLPFNIYDDAFYKLTDDLPIQIRDVLVLIENILNETRPK
jgi:hypothetical protein